MPFQPFWFLHHSHNHNKIRELIELDDKTKLTLEICDKIKDKNKRNFIKSVKKLLEN